MKQQFFVLLLVAGMLPSLVHAQSSKAYEGKMSNLLVYLKGGDTVETEWENRARGFDFLARTKGSDWHPYYYAAYCQINSSFKLTDGARIDSMTDEAEKNLAKADSLKGNASEITTLYALSTIAKLNVNMMERGMTYSRRIMQLLGKAQVQDSTNPRVFYLRTLMLSGMPKAMGGGKDAAKDEITIAQDKFTKFKTEDAFAPAWGKAESDNLFIKLYN
jgi:hypothetical protein